MKNVDIQINETSVQKFSVSPKGRNRILREKAVLEALAESPYVPNILSSTDTDDLISLELEYIDGESAKQWLELSENWTVRKLVWEDSRNRLRQYVEAEMDLLRRGVLYRDLNLEHIIFTNSKVVLVDCESAIQKRPNEGDWMLGYGRGTWETMAPEEFSVHGRLTERTATYRVAAFAHLVLAGYVPFVRYDRRSDTYTWRKKHPPKVDSELPKEVRRIFASALARKSIHRHKDPEAFLARLTKYYESI